MLNRLINSALLATLSIGVSVVGAKPMEPLTRSLYVFVHGTMDEGTGFLAKGCVAANGSANTATFQSGNGSFMNHFRNTVLPPGVNSFPFLYNGRAFMNPSNSPADLARELGDRTWLSTACPGGVETRALIEEATNRWFVQEGADLIDPSTGIEWASLQAMRDHPAGRPLIPYRVVLVSHSNGGLTSREYFTSTYYNGDVDKYVSMDTPHEGTPSLATLFDARDFDPSQVAVGAINTLALPITLLLFTANTAVTDYSALNLLIFWAAQAPLQEGLSALIAHFIGKQGLNLNTTDGIVPYIYPGSASLKTLNARSTIQNGHAAPAIRLYHARNGICFGAPEDVRLTGPLAYIIPPVFVGGFGNLIHGMSNDLPMGHTLFATSMGTMTGVNWAENGSSIVPRWSSNPSDVALFNRQDADIRKIGYEPHGTGTIAPVVSALNSLSVATAVLSSLSLTLGIDQSLVKWALGLSTSVAVAGSFANVMNVAGAGDYGTEFQEGHFFPVYHPENLNGTDRSFVRYTDRAVTVPVLKSSFEDFIFEKPFVQLRATSANDGLAEGEARDPAALEELGIFDQAGNPLVRMAAATLTARPIDYGNPGWDAGIGIKKTEYRYTPGAVAGHNPVLNRVNRYQMPPFAMSTTAFRYVFQVDDVLPQHMAQIKVNFNWNYSLIWQRENAAGAPYRLYREDFGASRFIANVNSPIDEDGVFTVEPFDPLYFGPTELKSLVQKENQNVITVSMVNHAGYATSQQMFFLSVLTFPVLQAEWPVPGASISTRSPQVSVFSNLFAFGQSGLFYDLGNSPVRTGFKFVPTDPLRPDAFITPDNLIRYDVLPTEATDEGETFVHNWAGGSTGNIPAAQGRYTFFARVQTRLNTQLVNNYIQRVPFAYDITPPALTLGLPDVPFNPEQSRSALSFSFVQGNRIELGEETALRFARARITEGGTTQYEFAPRDNLINPGLAYSWEGLDKDGNPLPDGEYTFQLAALDYAVPNRAAFDAVTAFHARFRGLADNALPAGFETDWAAVANGYASINTGFNGRVLSKDFIVDRAAPRIELTLKAVTASGATRTFPTDRTADGVLNRTEKLRIEYRVADRDAAAPVPVKVGWRFAGDNGTTVSTYASSQVAMTATSDLSASVLQIFEETLSAASFGDGEYTVTVELEDEAGNVRLAANSGWTFRVDRTPPQVVDFRTNSLTYRSASAAASDALWSVHEGGDLPGNQDGAALACHSRTGYPDGTYSSWAVTDDMDKTALPKSEFAGKPGLWLVEMTCLDAAGNEATRVFQYFVDRMYPAITSPAGSSPIKPGRIGIFGMAPNPDIFGLETSGSYSLSWKPSSASTWNVDRISVPLTRQGVGRRPNVSETVVPSVDYLGYWDATGLSGTYDIRLEASPCLACPGESVERRVVLSDLADGADFSFTLTKSFAEPLVPAAGKSVDFGLRFASDADRETELEGKIFGIDAGGGVLFEQDLTGISASSLHGRPTAMAMDGFYLWQEPSGQWQVQVKNVTSAFRLSLSYSQAATAGRFQAVYQGSPVQCEIVEQATGRILAVGDTPAGFKCTEMQFSVSQALQGGFNGEVDRQLILEAAGGASQSFAFTLASRAQGNFSYVAPTGTGGNLVLVNRVFVGKNAINLKGLAPGTANDYFAPLTLLATADDRIFNWNTRRQSGGLPKAGMATVRAEMTSVSPDGTRRTQTAEVPVNIAAVSLDLSIGRQSPFLTLQESVDEELGRITLTYGVHGQDALVTAGIRKAGSGEIVKTFFTRKQHTATVALNDKEISWNGITDRNFLADAGIHEFFIEAHRNAADPDPATRSAPFEVRFANFVDVSTGTDPGLVLQVEEAASVGADATYVVPKSNYRITARPVGEVEAARDFQYQVEYGGEQRLAVYPAERYSVGLRRKRSSFNVIVWVRMAGQGAHITSWPDCDFENRNFSQLYGRRMTFTEGTEETFDVTRIVGGRNIVGLFIYGSDRTRWPFDLDIKAIRVSSGEPTEPANDAEFNDVLAEDVLWSYSNHGFKDDPDPTPMTAAPGADPCTPGGDIDDVAICKDHSQPPDADSRAYDANKNLFAVTINHPTINPGAFSWGDFDQTGCNEHAHSDQAFGAKITLRVPPLYWEPGFGKDNLANRNMRFDPTSQTVAEYFNRDTYGHNNAGPGGTAVNSYMWLTPFEYQRHRLVPSTDAAVDPGNFHKLNPLSFAAEENPVTATEKVVYSFYHGPLSQPMELSWFRSQCTRPWGGGRFDPICTEAPVPLGSATTGPGDIPYQGVTLNLGTLQWTLWNYFFEIRMKDANHQRILDNSLLADVRIGWPATTLAPIDATRKPAGGTPDTRFCGAQADPAEGCFKAYNGASGIEYFLADGGGRVNKRPRSDYVNGSNAVIATANPDDISAIHAASLGSRTTAAVSATLGAVDPTLGRRTFTDIHHFKTAGGGVLASRQGPTDQYDLTSVLASTAQAVSVTNGVTVDPVDRTHFLQGPPQSWVGSRDPHLMSRDLDKDGLFDEESAANSDDDQDHGVGEDVPGTLNVTIREDADPLHKTDHLPLPGQPYKVNLLQQVYAPSIEASDRADSPDALFRYGTDWNANVRNVTLQGIAVRNIDGSINDAIEVEGRPVDLSLASFSDTKLAEWNVVRKSGAFARAKELITVRGRVPESGTTPGTPYRVNYLTSKGLLKTAFEGFYPRTGAPGSPEPILGYVDVSLLQGNTSLFLTYAQGSTTFFRKLNVEIGRPVGKAADFDAASSLYGDASVFFSPNSFAGERQFVTVRVLDPSELELSQNNQLSVVGPVVEILPSHDFGSLPDDQQPIVAINLSKPYLLGAPPASIRLYRPDRVSGNLVELRNQTYAFYDIDNNPVCLPVSGKNGTGICAEPWEWFTIAGNTSSFSEFMALDRSKIFTGTFSLAVAPAFSRSLDRTATITGLGASEYRLFVDDDPYYLDAGDATPKQELVLSGVTSSGSVLTGTATLPARYRSHLFLVPLVGGELATAEAKSAEVLYSAEDFQFTYTGPPTVHMGTANGRVVLPYASNHPGILQLVLEHDGATSGLLRDDLEVPGGSYVWDGKVNGAPIAERTYRSRLSAIDETGEGVMVSGPDIVADGRVPSAFLAGRISADELLLDYRFSDAGSGLAEGRIRVEAEGATVYGQSLPLVAGVNEGRVVIPLPAGFAGTCRSCEIVAALDVKDMAENSAKAEWRGNAGLTRKTLVLNTTASGANVGSALRDFPVLVRLDAANFDFSAVEPDGSDIRFTDVHGNYLPFEIEKWNGAEHEAAVWVKTDVAGNALTTLKMVWGNPLAPGGSSGREVFGEASGFQGVWHLNETGNSDASGYRDASANAIHGTGVNLGAASSVPGIAGDAQAFNGQDQHIRLPQSAAGPLDFPEDGEYTLSAWVRPHALDRGFHNVISKGNNQYGLLLNDGDNWEFVESNGGAWEVTTRAAAKAKWVHLVGVRKGAVQSLYVNGVLADNTIAAVPGSVRNSSFEVNIGRNSQNTGAHFPGYVDEVTLANTGRTADWIRLSYENQKPHQTLVTLDPEDYSEWRHVRKLVLNTAPGGANVAGTLENFPLLVRLGSGDFDFTEAEGAGADIRFASASGQPLEYEIERWDAAAGKAELWVLVPRILGNNSTQFIRMHWGKPGAAGRSQPKAVFHTADNYATVWHLAEAPAGDGQKTVMDATAIGNHAATQGGMAAGSRAEGRVGLALSFDGAANHLSHALGLNKPEGAVSAWMRPDQVRNMVAYYEADGSDGRYNGFGTGAVTDMEIDLGVFDGKWNFTYQDGPTVRTGGGSPAVGRWDHVVFKWDRTQNAKLFVNGNVMASAGLAATAFTSKASWLPRIGEVGNAQPDRHWKGGLDEMRVLDESVADDWIKLSYENQKENQSLVRPQDDLAGWNHSRYVVLNTSASGANVNGDVTDFPLLVRLDAGNFNFAEAAADGRDIRFAAEDGELLPHAVELWDAAGAKAAIWVRVPLVRGNNAGHYLRMYWGNPGAADIGNSAAVFPASDGYAGVWHLGEAPSGAGSVRDHSSNGRHGTPLGSVGAGSSVAGKIGYGISLDGTGDKVRVPGLLGAPGSVSLSGWAKLEARGAIGSELLSMGDAVALRLDNGGSRELMGFHQKPASGWNNTLVPESFEGDGWRHFAYVVDGSAKVQRLYVNGVERAVTRFQEGIGYSGLGADTYLGAHGNGNGGFAFGGVLDEIRVSNRALSGDRIRLGYENQKDGQSLVRLEAEPPCVGTGCGTSNAVVMEGQNTDRDYTMTGTQEFKIPLGQYSNTWARTVMVSLDDMDRRPMVGQFQFTGGSSQNLGGWYMSFPTGYTGQNELRFRITVPETRTYKVRWWYQ